MAAANGGNVEGTVAVPEDHHSRTVSRSSATPTSRVGCPRRPSQLYGTNLVNLMKLLTPGKDGELVLDFDDVVQRINDPRGARRGNSWPPPPVPCRRPPAAAATASRQAAGQAGEAARRRPARRLAVRRRRPPLGRS